MKKAKKENMLPYWELVERINAEKYADLSQEDFSARISALKKGLAGSENALVGTFALVKEAARRTLGLTAFDTQLSAGLAMQYGKLAEMPTGEGKTLAAVFPACWRALLGQRVHVLTFNDYLAHRDFEWMSPVYNCLGLSAGYISETMPASERRQMYARDVVYLTAKEAGFDYLRDFLCMKPSDLLHTRLDFALIDEADSILIDEGRIPLVLAGDSTGGALSVADISQSVAKLSFEDYNADELSNQAFLTESGIDKIESMLHLQNLYAEENLELLAMVNCCLQAHFLLRRDRDYIVRDSHIQIVDEFTGRVAENRHYPELLHAAVEAKEGICSHTNCMIYHSIAMQHFLQQYKSLAGMTGTAQTSAEEFWEMYDLEVVVIPPHKPCRRIDHDDAVFATKQQKTAAVLAAIQGAHGRNQPVLIGTASVQESEQISWALSGIGIPHSVLNAKNDAEEAPVIARAGEPGRVTVSTNMAGRGVDIKLGGGDETLKMQAEADGGLFVIGMNKHESIRIDNQLRGRAGRQGDPGESRIFVSLEDDLMQKYDLKSLIDSYRIEPDKEGRIADKRILHEVNRIQRIAQGAAFDARNMLVKYSYILEEQRKIITEERLRVLYNENHPHVLSEREPALYARLVKTAGKTGIEKAERQLMLYFINRNWAEYLETMSNVRDGIHLMVIGGKNPVDEYHRIAIETFVQMTEAIKTDVLAVMKTAEITPDGIDMEKEGLLGGTTTWTYLIDESSDQFSRLPYLVGAVSNQIRGAVFSISDSFKKLFRFKNSQN